jgi:hypothetical protein
VERGPLSACLTCTFWIGLDWIVLDWIELDWIGLFWIGLKKEKKMLCCVVSHEGGNHAQLQRNGLGMWSPCGTDC